jgi:hypothetical protein
MKTHIHAESAYMNFLSDIESQPIHSVLCWEGNVSPRNAESFFEWRLSMHRALDEFMDNLDFTYIETGKQYFIVGDAKPTGEEARHNNPSRPERLGNS